MSEPIVRLLFERGQFSPESTVAVGRILAIYGLGLPAFVLIKAFIPGFFAREDTRTPMIFAGISVAVNVSLALTLFPVLAASGIAMAEIAAGWVNALLLFATLVWRGHWGRDIALLTRIPRLVIAAAVMAAALIFAIDWLAFPLSSAASLATRALTLCGLIAGAMVIYFAVAFGIGGASLSMVRRSVKRGASASSAEPAGKAGDEQ
ncbi:murein biosynthesis integral membrane protein MurJ [Sinorhizobium medicae]